MRTTMHFHSWIMLIACLTLSCVTVEAAVLPPTDRLDAARRLESESGKWSVEWDTLTGAPSTIEPRGAGQAMRLGARGRRAGRDPISYDEAEQLARGWLWDHAALFGLRRGRDDFRLLFNHLEGREFQVVLGQLYEGVIVPTALTVWIDSRGRFTRYRGCFFAGLELESRPAVSKDEAMRIAWEDRRHAGARPPALPSLLVQTAGGACLVWNVRFSRAVDWYVVIDATTGEIFARSQIGEYR